MKFRRRDLTARRCLALDFDSACLRAAHKSGTYRSLRSSQSSSSGAIGGHNKTKLSCVRRGCHEHPLPYVSARCLQRARSSHRKPKRHGTPFNPAGPSLTRLLQGAAAALSQRSSSASTGTDGCLEAPVKKVANERADSAVVASLVPICVDKFRQVANATANLNESNKISYAWDRSTFVEKGGWATMPGAASPDSTVARACAEMLGNLKP